MKNFFYLLPLVLFGCKSNTTAIESGDISYKVNQESVSKTLQFLASDELEGRDPGSKSMEKAVSYLEKIYAENGVKPYFSTYKDTLADFPKTAYNIVGFIEGNDPKLKK